MIFVEETGEAREAMGGIGEQARRAAARAIRAAKDGEFHSLGLVLGYLYVASPMILDDGTPPLPESRTMSQLPGQERGYSTRGYQMERHSTIGWGTGCRS